MRLDLTLRSLSVWKCWRTSRRRKLPTGSRESLLMKSARNWRESATTSYAIGKRSTIRTDPRSPVSRLLCSKSCRNVRMMIAARRPLSWYRSRSKGEVSNNTNLSCIFRILFFCLFLCVKSKTFNFHIAIRRTPIININTAWRILLQHHPTYPYLRLLMPRKVYGD